MTSSIGSSSSSSLDLNWMNFLAEELRSSDESLQASSEVESKKRKIAEIDSVESSEAKRPTMGLHSFYSLANSYILDGNYSLALSLYDKFEADRPYCLLLYLKGIALYKLGRFNDALSVLEDSIKANPEHLETYHYKIRNLIALDRFEEARNEVLEYRKKFQNLSSFDLDDPNILYLEFKLELNKGNRVNAKACFDRLRTLFPQSHLLKRASEIFEKHQNDEWKRRQEVLVASVPVEVAGSDEGGGKS